MLHCRGPEGGAQTSAGPRGLRRRRSRPLSFATRVAEASAFISCRPLGPDGSTALSARTSSGPHVPPVWASESRTSGLPDFARRRLGKVVEEEEKEEEVAAT